LFGQEKSAIIIKKDVKRGGRILKFGEKIVSYNKNIKLIVSVMVIGIIMVFFVPQIVRSASLSDVYGEIKQRYSDEIQILINHGATEGQIESFIDALEEEISQEDSITEGNVNSIVANAVLKLFLEGQHDDVFEAVFDGWHLSDDTLLDAFENGGLDQVLEMLPNSFRGIGSLVKEELIDASNPEPDPGPGTGGSGGGGIGEGSGEELPEVITPPDSGTSLRTFDDINGHWAKGDIEYLAARGIIAGVKEGIFEPNRRVTRAEFVKMLVGILNLNIEDSPNKTFNDVSPGSWYYGYIAAAVNHGLVNGISENIFAPNSPITRQEMAVMAVNSLQIKGKVGTDQGAGLSLEQFKDVSEIAAWAEQACLIALKNQIMQGRKADVLAPREHTTRAESAVIIKRILEKIQG